MLPIDVHAGSRILISGAGGGFDFMCGLPLALALRAQGCQVHFANYSFTRLQALQGAHWPVPALCGVNAQTVTDQDYFPEGYLARWWKTRFGEDLTVWCIDALGVAPVREAYACMREQLGLDAMLVVDGGVDGLFLGNEYATGTPSMDAVSIVAAAQLGMPSAWFVCCAFGTEGRGFEVRHADALRRMAELINVAALAGVWAPASKSAVTRDYLHALDFVHRHMDPLRKSIVASSIAAAMEGAFGNTVLTPKTVDAPVWVSPLTLLYWFFELEAVAAAKPFRHEILDSNTVYEVNLAIEKTRHRLGILKREDIPI